MIALLLLGFTWTIFDEMRYSHFASPDWQHTWTDGVVSGTAAESPAGLQQYTSCITADQHPIHDHSIGMVFGPTYSCSLSAPGGWCRDIGLEWQIDHAVEMVCTLSLPGREPLPIILAIAVP